MSGASTPTIVETGTDPYLLAGTRAQLAADPT
jgi:hypothetical protein